MSTTLEAPASDATRSTSSPPPSADPSLPSRRISPVTIAFSLLALAAFAPLLADYGRWLWRLEHYQFFPIYLLGIGALGYLRWRECEPAGERRWYHRLPLYAGLALLTAAVLISSPWLAYVALLTCLFGLLVLSTDARGIHSLFPLVLLLALLLRPPMGMDVILVQQLQLGVSQVSSQIADWMGVNHLLAGNVFELPGQTLFVDEACSGVNSLLSTLALVAFFVVWLGRPWLHALLLIAATVGWVFAVNSLRVVTIVLANGWYGLDLAEGWPHTILAISLFPITLLLVVSTDEALGFLLGPISRPDSLLSEKWNRWIAKPLPLLGRAPAAQEEDASRPAERERAAQVPQTTRDRLPRGQVAILGLLSVLVLAQVVQAATSRSPRSKAAATFQELLAIEQEFLPAEVEGWQQADFQVERRERGNQWGEHSKIWRYRRGGDEFTASIDYPFTGWHDLTICYRGQGWIMADRTLVAGPGDEEFVQAEFYRPTGERAFLVFGNFDATGAALLPPDSSWNPVDVLRRRLASHPVRPEYNQTVYQLQILGVRDQPIGQEEWAEAWKCFAVLRERLGGQR